MVGLGLLLEQAWVATDAFVSLDGKNEKVWRVQNMAPGYGADSSGLICVGDIVVRVNGQSIPGVVFKLWRFLPGILPCTRALRAKFSESYC
jgi:C-terminal processing protease CtpA/Prc